MLLFQCILVLLYLCVQIKITGWYHTVRTLSVIDTI